MEFPSSRLANLYLDHSIKLSALAGTRLPHLVVVPTFVHSFQQN